MSTINTLKTERVSESVGAEVLDVDRDRLLDDENLPAALMDSLEANGVLVFRGLHIDDETQITLCRKLGELVVYPGQPIPELYVVSLDPEKNPTAGFLKATVYWHCDDTMQPIPSKATMLSAKVLAAEGGETEFASTYAAYDDLSDEEKERFAALRVVHSQVRIQGLVYPNPTEEQLAQWREPGRMREHPLVWTHAAGRRSLVIGQTTDYVVGMDQQEGRALLDGLLANATRPGRVYRHVWSEGDTIIYDNPGVLHRVMPYDVSSGREMHRTTLAGDKPIQ